MKINIEEQPFFKYPGKLYVTTPKGKLSFNHGKICFLAQNKSGGILVNHYTFLDSFGKRLKSSSLISYADVDAWATQGYFKEYKL